MTHAACVATPCATGPGSHAPSRGVIVARWVSIPGGSCLVHHRSLNHGYGCGCGTAHAPCLPVHAHRQAAPHDSTVLIVPKDLLSPRCVALPYATAPAGTRSRVQSSVATDPDVLLRPLCWCGAQPCFLKRARWVALACVSVGLASGCSYGEAAQLKGEDDGCDSNDKAECPEGGAQSECDANGSSGAGLSLLSRRATGTRAAWRNGLDRSARGSSSSLRSSSTRLRDARSVGVSELFERNAFTVSRYVGVDTASTVSAPAPCPTPMTDERKR